MIKEEKKKRGRPRSNQTLEERLKRLAENAKRYYNKKKKEKSNERPIS
jgi:hypothetical protein